MSALGLRPSGRLGLSPRRRRPSSFFPGQLPDLAMWWRAGDPQNTITAGAVEQAFDLSGNGRHLGQTTSTKRPLDTTDPSGKPVMKFDGVDDVLQITTGLPALGGGITAFVAYRLRQHVNGQGIIAAGKAGAGQDNDQYFGFNSAFSAHRTVLAAKDTLANPLNTGNRTDPRGDPNYAVFVIGNSAAELRDFLGSASDIGTSSALGTPDVIALGARCFNQSATPPFGANLYEAGIYARALEASELAQLETYLKAEHSVRWSPGYLDSGLAWWHDDWSAFTLSGSLVDQWNDRSGNGRHWTASGSARPDRTVDAGNLVVRFDGTDDALQMAGTKPVFQPLTATVVYRVRNRGDFEGVLSAAAASGIDHESFWTFENASAASGDMQLFGRSLEANQLALIRPDTGLAQIAIWTAGAGSASLRDRFGEITDTYGGSLGTPAAVVLGARYNASPFNHAEVDVMATVGATSVLSTVEQQQLIDWAIAKWGV